MQIIYDNNELDPNKWEELISQLYRIRYKDVGYHYVPARDDGDCGIEGYTDNGIVYQCYYPEGEYSSKDLYEHLRDKMTRDLGKLYTNEQKLKKLGISDIKEWHFVIPNYEDKKILEHANTKKEELLKSKAEGKISVIHDNIKIYIKVLDDFQEELNVLMSTNKEYKYVLPKIENIDFSLCDSEKKNNISQKLEKLLTKNGEIDEENLKKAVNIYINYYIKGIQMLNEIKMHSPQLYEEFIKVEGTYRNEVEIKCVTNTDNAINQQIFNEVLNGFEEKLKEELGKALQYSDIGELKQEMIGKWLADCPLNFVG